MRQQVRIDKLSSPRSTSCNPSLLGSRSASISCHPVQPAATLSKNYFNLYYIRRLTVCTRSSSVRRHAALRGRCSLALAADLTCWCFLLLEQEVRIDRHVTTMTTVETIVTPFNQRQPRSNLLRPKLPVCYWEFDAVFAPRLYDDVRVLRVALHGRCSLLLTTDLTGLSSLG